MIQLYHLLSFPHATLGHMWLHYRWFITGGFFAGPFEISISEHDRELEQRTNVVRILVKVGRRGWKRV